MWDDYKKQTKPLKKTAKKAMSAHPAAKPLPTREAISFHETAPVSHSLITTDWDAPLGRTMERDLRAGDVTLDAQLDLHGMTQSEAHHALARFIASHAKRGHRQLLIITGRGGSRDQNGETGHAPITPTKSRGIIRAKLREWLEALPDAHRILRISQASPRHGGAGAFYVMLKRGD